MLTADQLAQVFNHNKLIHLILSASSFIHVVEQTAIWTPL